MGPPRVGDDSLLEKKNMAVRVEKGLSNLLRPSQFQKFTVTRHSVDGLQTGSVFLEARGLHLLLQSNGA